MRRWLWSSPVKGVSGLPEELEDGALLFDQWPVRFDGFSGASQRRVRFRRKFHRLGRCDQVIADDRCNFSGCRIQQDMLRADAKIDRQVRTADVQCRQRGRELPQAFSELSGVGA
jgi:hypothetical protein